MAENVETKAPTKHAHKAEAHAKAEEHKAHPAESKAAETKPEPKAAKAPEKAKAEEKKAPAKKKWIPYVKKKNEKKSEEAKKVRDEIAAEGKWHPVFRGRFGKKNIRRKSIAKWDKWRKPHGIDLDRCIAHGFRPKTGYRTRAEIRGVHPSGYKEVMVCNMNDIAKIDPKTQAARISAAVGKRKRNEIVAKANEKKVWVLN